MLLSSLYLGQYRDTNFDYYYHFKSDMNSEGVYVTTISYWATFLSDLEDAELVNLGSFNNNIVNLEHPLVFNVYGFANDMMFKYFNAVGENSYILYPASNLDKTRAGFYDVVNKKFYSVTNFTLGNVTISPDIPENPDTPTDSPNDKDYTENFDNLQNSVEDLNKTQQETNDFLKDDTVNDSEFTLPSIEVNDPTANFFDVMFQGLYNAVTSETIKPISIDVMGIKATVSPSDFNFLGDERFSVLRFILNASWVVSIGLLILKDLRSIIEDIKNGNIESVASKGDIKANIV